MITGAATSWATFEQWEPCPALQTIAAAIAAQEAEAANHSEAPCVTEVSSATADASDAGAPDELPMTKPKFRLRRKTPPADVPMQPNKRHKK